MSLQCTGGSNKPPNLASWSHLNTSVMTGGVSCSSKHNGLYKAALILNEHNTTSSKQLNSWHRQTHSWILLSISPSPRNGYILQSKSLYNWPMHLEFPVRWNSRQCLPRIEWINMRYTGVHTQSNKNTFSLRGTIALSNQFTCCCCCE